MVAPSITVSSPSDTDDILIFYNRSRTGMWNSPGECHTKPSKTIFDQMVVQD